LNQNGNKSQTLTAPYNKTFQIVYKSKATDQSTILSRNPTTIARWWI